MPKIAQPLIVAATLALLAACSSPQPSPPPASMAPPPGPMAAPAPPMEEPYVAPSTGPRRHHVVHRKGGKKVVHHVRHRRGKAKARPAAMAPAPMAPAPMAPAPSQSTMPGPRPSGR